MHAMPDSDAAHAGVDLAARLTPLTAQLPDALCPSASFEAVAPEAVPRPYRDLLHHNADMTSTLARFFAGEVRIQVLRAARRGDIYSRCVLLRLERDDRVVEFGGIDIYLAHFPEAARRLILAEEEPLGGILNRLGVPYISRPHCLMTAACAALDSLLPRRGDEVLYGRCNSLVTPDGRVLARIVELLPIIPAQERAS